MFFREKNTFGHINIGFDDLNDQPNPIDKDLISQMNGQRFAVDYVHAAGNQGNQNTGANAKADDQRRIDTGK